MPPGRRSAGVGSRRRTNLHNINFADYARMCGGTGIRVESAANLKAALDAALAAEGPSLVEIMADPMLT